MATLDLKYVQRVCVRKRTTLSCLDVIVFRRSDIFSKIVFENLQEKWNSLHWNYQPILDRKMSDIAKISSFYKMTTNKILDPIYGAAITHHKL